MSKEIDGPIAVLGCFGLIVLVPVAACLDGYVLSVLWWI
jgi:hypothetical protein